MTTPVVLITGALTGIGRDGAGLCHEGACRCLRPTRRGRRELVAELRKVGLTSNSCADVRHEDDVRSWLQDRR